MVFRACEEGEGETTSSQEPGEGLGDKMICVAVYLPNGSGRRGIPGRSRRFKGLRRESMCRVTSLA